jgi:DNA invertase Pin-like site-specific DNA recombinase
MAGKGSAKPDIPRLMRDAQHGEFSVLLAEALDRISRDQADVATLYKQLKFAGVTIPTFRLIQVFAAGLQRRQ